MNSVSVDLSYLCPEEKQWEDFVTYMQRKHKYIESKTIGTLDYHYKNEYLEPKVINALVALILQSIILTILLVYIDLGNVALCIVTIVYSLVMCILNNVVMNRNLPITNDFKKNYLFPLISSIVMGAVAFGIHALFSFLLGYAMNSAYFINLFSTLIIFMQFSKI